MQTDMSSAQQMNAASEGFALGLLICGYDSLLFDQPGANTLAARSAFQIAWGRWKYHARFPHVTHKLRGRGKLNEDRVMTWATVRRNNRVCYWDDYDVYVRDGYRNERDFEKMALNIDGDLPASAWRELASLFLKELHVPEINAD